MKIHQLSDSEIQTECSTASTWRQAGVSSATCLGESLYSLHPGNEMDPGFSFSAPSSRNKGNHSDSLGGDSEVPVACKREGRGESEEDNGEGE